MRALAFSDIHTDVEQAAQLASMAAEADLVIGAGDFASVHERLDETIAPLTAIDAPTVLVPGNNETEDALRRACDGWEAAIVLHGEGAEVAGRQIFGLGAGVPVTPWDWSYDLTDDEAREMLADCPEGAILVLHSPPAGHCDLSGGGESLGSQALAEAIESKRPQVAVFGHIHESWGCESELAGSRLINLGPGGTWLDL